MTSRRSLFHGSFILPFCILIALLAGCEQSPDEEQTATPSRHEQPTPAETGTALSETPQEEPLISVECTAQLQPLLAPWLAFHDLDLSLFRHQNTQHLDIFAPGDADRYYFEAFDPEVHERQLPRIRDYSPDGRRYINLLEATMVFEKDGTWHFKGSDDAQQIRLVDLDVKRSIMFYYSGTTFVEAVFWLDDDTFAMVFVDDTEKDYVILLYDLSDNLRTRYRYHADTLSGASYLSEQMRRRGVIVD